MVSDTVGSNLALCLDTGVHGGGGGGSLKREGCLVVGHRERPLEGRARAGRRRDTGQWPNVMHATPIALNTVCYERDTPVKGESLHLKGGVGENQRWLNFP